MYEISGVHRLHACSTYLISIGMCHSLQLEMLCLVTYVVLMQAFVFFVHFYFFCFPS